MIENHIEGTLQELLTSPVVSSFKVIRQEIAENEGFIRIKCLLSDGGIMEFAEYLEIHSEEVSIETYSYHWQDLKGNLIRRWDNVRHNKEVSTYPHHLHLENSEVIKSIPMNLKKALREIEGALSIL